MARAKHKPETSVVMHTDVRGFELSGSLITGLAIPTRGAAQIEVWHMIMNRGAVSPIHSHDAEEIFVVVAGHGEIHAGGKQHEFTAPCTVICPAHEFHQVVNAGGGKLELYAMVPVGSKVYLEDGKELKLPWRQ